MLQGSKSEQISGIRLRKSSTVCKSTPALSPLTAKALIAWQALNFSNHPFEALKSAMSNWLANSNALLYRIGPESGIALSWAWRNQSHIRSFRLSCLLLFPYLNFWTFSLLSKPDLIFLTKNKNFLLPIKDPQGANNLIQWLKWLETYM